MEGKKGFICDATYLFRHKLSPKRKFSPQEINKYIDKSADFHHKMNYYA